MPRRKKQPEDFLVFNLPIFFDLWYKYERSRENFSRPRYTKTAKLILKEIAQFIIENNTPFVLPYRLGKIHTKRTKYKTGNVDFIMSVKKQKLIRNFHKKRIPTYRFHWDKKRTNIAKKRFYRFKESKYTRRTLTQYIRDNLDNPFVMDFERL